MTSLILHDIRSLHNVGSILRTADGFGVDHVYMTGHTPYPRQAHDSRLPHVIERTERQLHKTALGAEHTVKTLPADIKILIPRLQSDGNTVVAVEQTPRSKPIHTFTFTAPIALVLGNEVEGLPQDIIRLCNEAVEIPMRGKKKSFNVSVAAAIALYAIQSHP